MIFSFVAVLYASVCADRNKPWRNYSSFKCYPLEDEYFVNVSPLAINVHIDRQCVKFAYAMSFRAICIRDNGKRKAYDRETRRYIISAKVQM